MNSPVTNSESNARQQSEFERLRRLAPTLRPSVLQMALMAHDCANREGLVENRETLTVIDYSLPSTEARMWVFDLASSKLLWHELVAHGRNSGNKYTKRFSNKPGSLKSSLGLFTTGKTYMGSNGYSLRLHGLEAGVNDRALARAIVIHGAAYVNADIAGRLGRLGRSWGCPSVRRPVARELINAIRGGSTVLAYYPDEAWLRGSRFLSGCRESPAKHSSATGEQRVTPKTAVPHRVRFSRRSPESASIIPKGLVLARAL